MNTSEFAEYIGVSPQRVRIWCRSGRLPGVTRGPGGWWIDDPVAAKAAWVAQADFTHASSALVRDAAESGRIDQGSADLLEESNEALQHWRASMAELKYKEAASKLIPVDEIETEGRAMADAIRAKLAVELPARIQQRLPHLDMTLFRALVDEALFDINKRWPPTEELS